MHSVMNEEYINEWLQTGETIAQGYQGLLSECGCLADFNLTYTFAGKYEGRNQLNSSYERIENVADDISDDKARILGDYCSYGRLLFLNSNSDDREVRIYMQNKEKLPGMKDVANWFRAGKQLADSDRLLQIADDVEGQGAVKMFLLSFNRGGKDVDVVTLGSAYNVLKYWAARHPNNRMRSQVTEYEQAGRRLFFSGYYDIGAVRCFIKDTGQQMDLTKIREQYRQKLDCRKREEEERRRKERERQVRLKQEESFWNSTRQTDTKSAYQNYLRKYPDGIHKKQAKQRLREKNKRKRRILIVVAVLVALKVIPTLYVLASDFYETHFKCHTLEVLNDPVFTTTDYDAQLAVLDSVISHTKRKKCVEDIMPYYQHLDSLNVVLHELRPLFSKPKNGRSRVENYCKKKADYMDSIILVRDYLLWAETAAPDDNEIKKSKADFEKLVKKYKIKFPE